MGSVSIDLSLKYIWQCWFRAFKGKRPSAAVHRFQYHLEHELYQLYSELNNKTYQHGGYQQFIVADNKRRQISMASVRDRIVHRLLYEYLVDLYDTHFSYDVWSCRKGKGVVAALNRASFLLQSHPHSFIWRADVVKFFDTVDHAVLKQILARRVTDPTATWLIHAVIDSFAVHTPTQHSTQPNRTIGIPIGNLTSQIFSNIYLN
jgi:retron-type reverse transcriptase